MSAVIFTTRTSMSSVAGTERARGAHLAARITAHRLQLNTLPGMERARRILPDAFFMLAVLEKSKSKPLTEVETFARWAPVAGALDEATMWVEPGPQLDLAASLDNARTQGVMETVLNTAISAGNDAQVLLARIDGSAEEGIYIAEQDRPWLADIITKGATLPGALHRNHPERWEAVARHLHDTHTHPGPALLTCSQGASVRQLGAQDTGIVDIANIAERDAAWDAFQGLDATTAWDRSIDAIAAARTNKPWLRLSPQTFRQHHYGDGFTAQDAVDAADAWWYRKLGIQI